MQVSQHQLIYPPSSLQQTTIENAKRIHQLEHLIRAERQELDRLLIQNASPSPKRTRHSPSPPSPPSPPSSPSPPSPPSPSTPPSSSTPPTTPPPLSSASVPTTPPAPTQVTPHSSPKGIMYPYHNSYPPPQPSDRKPPVREMAARGSHWSFVEKARFEAALHKYGPFAWDRIIQTVGTRSEKQVKAYAARYRRRKKLAAKAQLEAAERLPIHTAAPLQPSLRTIQRPLRLSPTPPTSLEEEPRSPLPDNPPLPEPLQQLDNLIPSDQDNLDDSTMCDDFFAGNSLFDTPLVTDAVELPDVNDHSDPSEVELLVDRALQGEFEMDDRIDQEEDAKTPEDPCPTEFLNSVFIQ